MQQKGYSATLEYEYTPSFPLSLSAQISTAENGFLDYGLTFAFRSDSHGSVNLETGLAFTFTLIKQDTYMPISLTVEPEIFYSDFISGRMEPYEGIGFSFAGSLIHVMRLAHRHFLSLGLIASFERTSYSSQEDTLSPYSDSTLRIGPTFRYTFRDYPLNSGNSGEARFSILFGDRWSPAVRIGFSFLRYKESSGE